MMDGLMDEAVAHGRDAEGANADAEFGYIHALLRLRPLPFASRLRLRPVTRVHSPPRVSRNHFPIYHRPIYITTLRASIGL